jgi:hypothetical protein
VHSHNASIHRNQEKLEENTSNSESTLRTKKAEEINQEISTQSKDIVIEP